MSSSRFELLPNEILLECFQYLNIIDLFHSFDQLNLRFNTLIRDIPFNLTFENIHNISQCQQFCVKLSNEQTLKNHLYSLHLSNQNTCYPIHLFLSQFSLLEFPHLHSITLHKITKNNWKSIQSTLSSIPELSVFRMIDCPVLLKGRLSVLLLSRLQTLIIPDQPLSKSISHMQFSSIIHLSICETSLDVLFILFSNASKLKYLKIKYNHPKSLSIPTNDVKYTNSPANNLKTLHLSHFHNDFHYLTMLLEQTRNLENLIILSYNISNIINAFKWQSLITSSLPHLNNFQFSFYFKNLSAYVINEESLKEFRNEFWCDEHYWYTEYIFSPSSALIYTVPYPFHTFGIFADGQRYCYQSINHLNIFDNVKHLIFVPQATIHNDPFYFPNVDLLTVGFENFLYRSYNAMKFSHLVFLQAMINLSNIKHLALNDLSFETSNILIEILKSVKQLTSLKINLNDLRCCFQDDELCKYLNKSIQKLEICSVSFDNLDQLEEFCKIFNNLKQLECFSNKSGTLFLIKYLPKLTFLRINDHSKFNQISYIKQEVEKLAIDITATLDDDDRPRNLFIWINRH